MNQQSNRPRSRVDTSEVDALLQETKGSPENRDIIKHSVATAYFKEAMDQFTVWTMVRRKPEVIRNIISELNTVLEMVDEVLDTSR